MPDYTENYDLEKPIQTEFYNVEVQNGNMDKIDTNMKVAADNVSALSISLNNLSNNLDNYLPLSGGMMTGDIAMGSNKITSVATPTDSTDVANKEYVDSKVAGTRLKYIAAINTTLTLTLDKGIIKFVIKMYVYRNNDTIFARIGISGAASVPTANITTTSTQSSAYAIDYDPQLAIRIPGNAIPGLYRIMHNQYFTNYDTYSDAVMAIFLPQLAHSGQQIAGSIAVSVGNVNSVTTTFANILDVLTTTETIWVSAPAAYDLHGNLIIIES